MPRPEKRGSSWRVAWRYGGTRDGARQSKTFGSKREADLFATRIAALGHRVRSTDRDVMDGSLLMAGNDWIARQSRDDIHGGMTWAQWWPQFQARRNVSVSTAKDHDQLQQRRFKSWQNLPIASITAHDAERLVADIQRAGLDPRTTINLGHSVLRLAMIQGHHPGPVNPFAAVRNATLRTQRSPGTAATPDEIRALLAVADRRTALLIRLASECGLRMGEALALTYADLGATSLRVERSRSKIVGQPVNPPKTARGRRKVVAPEDLLQDLRDWYADHANVTGWLFPGQDDSLPITLSMADKRWRITRAAAGVRPLRFHDLRHTYATRLISSGVPLSVVSGLMGHGSTAVTDAVYWHLTDTTDDAVLAALAATRAPQAPPAAPLRLVGGA